MKKIICAVALASGIIPSASFGQNSSKLPKNIKDISKEEMLNIFNNISKEKQPIKANPQTFTASTNRVCLTVPSVSLTGAISWGVACHDEYYCPPKETLTLELPKGGPDVGPGIPCNYTCSKPPVADQCDCTLDANQDQACPP